MKIRLILLCCWVLFGFTVHAQTKSGKDTLLVYATVFNGDTIPMGYLHQVNIWCPHKFKSERERNAYMWLKRDVQLVYPYAMKASQLLVEINTKLSTIKNSRERRRFIKSQENVLNEQFKKRLVGMTTTQGRLLMLLIDRQTGNSCYELVKEFKGGFKAWVYNSTMSIYDSDLNMKRHYMVGDNPLLDRVLFEIETDQLEVKSVR